MKSEIHWIKLKLG